ncbi:MAG: 4-vinyl reductase [Candidatus Freyarchaeum deiterrae]
MKIRKTGIDYIDKTLGRLYDGLSILLASDSFSLNDANRLAGLLALNFVEKGGAVITINTNLPFNIVQRQFKKNYSDEKNAAFQNSINDGRFYYLDLVSGENKTNATYSSIKNIRGIANDLNSIIYEINGAKNQIKQLFPDLTILVIYANISSSIIDFDSKTVLKMIRKLTMDTKREGGILLGIANRDVHEPQVINTLNHLVDYAINLGFETIGDKKQSYVHVSRTPLVSEAHKILNQRLAYLFTHDNFITLFPLYDSFDELKEGMSFNELGQVSLFGWNHVIAPIQVFTLPLETMKSLLIYEEYRRIIFDSGLRVGISVSSFIESERQINNKKLLEEVIKYITVTGWGRPFSMEGSIDEGKLKLTFISTIALSYGHSDYPVCTFIEGALAGTLQVATKKEWKCRETKCIAKGDEYCEFEVELK